MLENLEIQAYNTKFVYIIRGRQDIGTQRDRPSLTITSLQYTVHIRTLNLILLIITNMKQQNCHYLFGFSYWECAGIHSPFINHADAKHIRQANQIWSHFRRILEYLSSYKPFRAVRQWPARMLWCTNKRRIIPAGHILISIDIPRQKHIVSFISSLCTAYK